MLGYLLVGHCWDAYSAIGHCRDILRLGAGRWGTQEGGDCHVKCPSSWQHGKRPIVLCLDHAVVAATFTFHAVSNPLLGVRMDQIWGSTSWRLPIRLHGVFHVQVDTSLPSPWQLHSIVFCGLWKGRSCLAPLPLCMWIDRFASWCVATASTRTASRWGFVTHDSMCYDVFMSGRREITFACGAGMGKN